MGLSTLWAFLGMLTSPFAAQCLLHSEVRCRMAMFNTVTLSEHEGPFGLRSHLGVKLLAAPVLTVFTSRVTVCDYL